MSSDMERKMQDVYDAPTTPRMDFGQALQTLRAGARVMRHGWNGKGMWLALADGGTWKQDGYTQGDLAPHIVMKTADNKFVPWLASQTDILALDWCEVALPVSGARA